MAEVAGAREFEGGARLGVGCVTASTLAFVLFAIGAAFDLRQAVFSYLVAFAFVTSLQLGALAFLMIAHAAHAEWTVPLRRLNEGLVAGVTVAPILFLPVLFGAAQLYPWAGAGPRAAHAEHAANQLYLNAPFFATRAALYFALWIGLFVLLFRGSVRADTDASLAAPANARWLSAAGLPALGMTLTFAAFDWLMSLDPHWSSSVFGIYCFAGGFVGSIALLTLATRASEQAGLLRGIVSPAHYYALGRLLLAFTIFWAYIAYFQLFLIYIGNKPDEVTFYVLRNTGSWRGFSFGLVFGHFAIPFLLLLLRGLKRLPLALCAVAGWIVLMHYADMYWLVMPALQTRGVRPHWLDLCALVAVAGAAASISIALLRGHKVVPLNDPALAAGIAYRSW